MLVFWFDDHGSCHYFLATVQMGRKDAPTNPYQHIIEAARRIVKDHNAVSTATKVEPKLEFRRRTKSGNIAWSGIHGGWAITEHARFADFFKHAFQDFPLHKLGTHSMKKTVVTLMAEAAVSWSIISGATGTSVKMLQNTYDISTLSRQPVSPTRPKHSGLGIMQL